MPHLTRDTSEILPVVLLALNKVARTYMSTADFGGYEKLQMVESLWLSACVCVTLRSGSDKLMQPLLDLPG